MPIGRLLSLAVAAALALTGRAAAATICNNSGELRQRAGSFGDYDAATIRLLTNDVVFAARVVAMTPDSVQLFGIPEVVERVTLDVIRSWKGEPGPTVELFGATGEGSLLLGRYGVGQTLVVYANVVETPESVPRVGPPLDVYACGGTAEHVKPDGQRYLPLSSRGDAAARNLFDLLDAAEGRLEDAGIESLWDFGQWVHATPVPVHVSLQAFDPVRSQAIAVPPGASLAVLPVEFDSPSPDGGSSWWTIPDRSRVISLADDADAQRAEGHFQLRLLPGLYRVVLWAGGDGLYEDGDPALSRYEDYDPDRDGTVLALSRPFLVMAEDRFVLLWRHEPSW